ncbi:hypothetical protein ABDK96_02005 [Citricoccus nitrophenolicus]|uniref:Uncharacterized protein n=1 Tax=Citricoccus nitrophenolicus TaxID=863575 RepID=A0ABV0IE60_9MICC
MTTLDPEGLERAAEEVADEMPSCAVCEDRDTRRCQYCRREAERYARAAVTAYLEHVNPVVTTMEELDALPVGSVVMDLHGALTAGTAHNGRRLWDYTGNDVGAWSEDIALPATVIHRGKP